MATKARVVPKFKTEAEEAQWWYDNREQHGEGFAQAMRAGKTKRLTKELLAKRIEASKAVNIRFDSEDLALARKLAERKGLPYQTFIKSLLHEALQRESRQVG